MDEMKISLGSKFMKGIAAKVISKAIKSKTGYKIDIQFDDLDFWVLNGDTTIKLNLEAKMKSDEFNKLIKSIDME